jgi:hypothetical protein
MAFTIKIAADGTAQFIYNDTLAFVLKPIGDIKIERASHVEPSVGGGWYVDLRPVGGPILYGDGWMVTPEDHDAMQAGQRAAIAGYTSRAEALAAEVRWLENNRGFSAQS